MANTRKNRHTGKTKNTKTKSKTNGGKSKWRSTPFKMFAHGSAVYIYNQHNKQALAVLYPEASNVNKPLSRTKAYYDKLYLYCLECNNGKNDPFARTFWEYVSTVGKSKVRNMTTGLFLPSVVNTTSIILYECTSCGACKVIRNAGAKNVLIAITARDHQPSYYSGYEEPIIDGTKPGKLLQKLSDTNKKETSTSQFDKLRKYIEPRKTRYDDMSQDAAEDQATDILRSRFPQGISTQTPQNTSTQPPQDPPQNTSTQIQPPQDPPQNTSTQIQPPQNTDSQLTASSLHPKIRQTRSGNFSTDNDNSDDDISDDSSDDSSGISYDSIGFAKAPKARHSSGVIGTSPRRVTLDKNRPSEWARWEKRDRIRRDSEKRTKQLVGKLNTGKNSQQTFNPGENSQQTFNPGENSQQTFEF